MARDFGWTPGVDALINISRRRFAVGGPWEGRRSALGVPSSVSWAGVAGFGVSAKKTN
jgi:hypothetical protein